MVEKYARYMKREQSLSSKQGAGKPHKQRTFRLLVCVVIPIY